MNNLEISKFKIAWKWLTGGKEAVFDYLLEIVNRAAAQASEGTKEKAAKLYASISAVHEKMATLDWLVPKGWRDDYIRVMSAIAALLDALADGQVSRAELDGIISHFNDAYIEWHKD